MSWMTPTGSTTVLHTKTKKRAWTRRAYGTTVVQKTRSYANRAQIFAITTGIAAPRPAYSSTPTPGPGISWPRWINVKLHSMQTWKEDPLNVDASTQFNLNRDDAEFLVVGLMAAIAEFDRLEAEESE